MNLCILGLFKFVIEIIKQNHIVRCANLLKYSFAMVVVKL